MWDLLRRWFSKPAPAADDPIWCVAATVIEAQPLGDSAVRTGAKHFRAGAKVYCFPALWGDGLENIQVIGHGRWKGRFVQVIVPSKRLTGFRVERVYSPWVRNRMKHHWHAGEESRRIAEDMVRWLGERRIEKSKGIPNSRSY
ncbi:MAG: hypothetical protein ACKV22_02345 [Bryobacteraceae bacterium]